MHEPDLAVAEIFTSLQGEGPFAGQPAVFIRLAGCMPPYCPWCDTPRALTVDSDTPRMSLREIEAETARRPDDLVVITGGEPFLQWNNGLAQLAGTLTRTGRRVQYETSGRAGIPEHPPGFVVCSPKPVHAPRLAPELIPRVDAFKFVVDRDLAPILDFIRTHAIPANRVWLMPLGATRSEQTERMPKVWAQCVRHGFNLSSRLHILTFDDKQGV
jgi:7-carboxy-7-deazaguanine synthase